MPSWPPKKNTAFTIYLPILDADGDLVTGGTGLSSQISGDGAVFGAGPTPVEEGQGFYSIALTAAQMNFDNISGVLITTTTGAKNTPFSIYTVSRQMDDLAYPATSGRSLDVDASGRVVLQAISHAGATVPTVTAITNDVGITATAVDNIWNELTAEARTAGSYGQLFKDYVNASVSAIKAKTDSLTFTAANKVDATLNIAADVPNGTVATA